jgi:hypothetical protein
MHEVMLTSRDREEGLVQDFRSLAKLISIKVNQTVYSVKFVQHSVLVRTNFDRAS